MESEHQEQSCLELIAELKLAQDGVFKIHVHVAFKHTLIQKVLTASFTTNTFFVEAQ